MTVLVTHRRMDTDVLVAVSVQVAATSPSPIRRPATSSFADSASPSRTTAPAVAPIEGSRREVRSGPRRPEMAQAMHEQHQAHAISEKADRSGGEQRARRWTAGADARRPGARLTEPATSPFSMASWTGSAEDSLRVRSSSIPQHRQAPAISSAPRSSAAPALPRQQRRHRRGSRTLRAAAAGRRSRGTPARRCPWSPALRGSAAARRWRHRSAQGRTSAGAARRRRPVSTTSASQGMSERRSGARAAGSSGRAATGARPRARCPLRGRAGRPSSRDRCVPRSSWRAACSAPKTGCASSRVEAAIRSRVHASKAFERPQRRQVASAYTFARSRDLPRRSSPTAGRGPLDSRSQLRHEDRTSRIPSTGTDHGRHRVPTRPDRSDLARRGRRRSGRSAPCSWSLGIAALDGRRPGQGAGLALAGGDQPRHLRGADHRRRLRPAARPRHHGRLAADRRPRLRRLPELHRRERTASPT